MSRLNQIPILRPFQEKAKSQIEADFEFCSRLLYVQPTGTGKTKLLCSLAKKYVDQGQYVLICVHKIELLDQICADLREFRLDPGVIAGSRLTSKHKQIQVCSIQTLIKRIAPPADLIIIDECHHAKSVSYQKIWGIYPTARILGVTATPVRLDGDTFEDCFDKLIELYPISWYVKEGYLVESFHHMLTYPKEIVGISKENKDYDTEELERLVISKEYIHNPYLAYIKYSPGKKAIIFCPTVKSSKIIAQYFIDKGIPAAHLDCDVPPVERLQINEDFKAGKILILTNRDIVAEGYDVPDLDVVILARKTKSFSLYMQMIGRVLRPDRLGLKKYGIILDVAGLYAEHKITGGDDVEWNLKGEHKKADDNFILPKSVTEQTGIENFTPEVVMALNPDNGDLIPIPIPDTSAVTTGDAAISEAERNEMMASMFGSDNLVLVPINDQMKNLVIFEAYLKSAENNHQKLLSALYNYKNYIRVQNRGVSDREIEYCKQRLNQLNAGIKPGFWHHFRIEQKEFENTMRRLPSTGSLEAA